MDKFIPLEVTATNANSGETGRVLMVVPSSSILSIHAPGTTDGINAEEAAVKLAGYSMDDDGGESRLFPLHNFLDVYKYLVDTAPGT